MRAGKFKSSLSHEWGGFAGILATGALVASAGGRGPTRGVPGFALGPGEKAVSEVCSSAGLSLAFSAARDAFLGSAKKAS